MDSTPPPVTPTTASTTTPKCPEAPRKPRLTRGRLRNPSLEEQKELLELLKGVRRFLEGELYASVMDLSEE